MKVVGQDDATRQPLTSAQERLWRGIARMMVSLPRAIDDDLMARTGLSLSSYITLSQLSESPERRLRMHDLAERSALSPSRMTRVVQGLQDAGYVQRTTDPHDRRVGIATLTDAGLERLVQAWPNHLESVLELALDHIHRDEVVTLTAAVERIVAAVEARR